MSLGRIQHASTHGATATTQEQTMEQHASTQQIVKQHASTQTETGATATTQEQQHASTQTKTGSTRADHCHIQCIRDENGMSEDMGYYLAS